MSWCNFFKRPSWFKKNSINFDKIKMWSLDLAFFDLVVWQKGFISEMWLDQKYLTEQSILDWKIVLKLQASNVLKYMRGMVWRILNKGPLWDGCRLLKAFASLSIPEQSKCESKESCITNSPFSRLNGVPSLVEGATDPRGRCVLGHWHVSSGISAAIQRSVYIWWRHIV